MGDKYIETGAVLAMQKIRKMADGKYTIKVYVFLLLLLGCGVSSIRVAAQPTPAMSLQDCIDYALENNIDMKNARLDVNISRHKVQETLSIGLPQISGQITTSGNFIRPYSFLPGEFLGKESGTFVGVQFSPTYIGRMAVDFEQMIFVGSYFVGLKAARAYVDASRVGKVKKEVDLVEAVSKAYYLVLVNHTREKLVKKNYERIDSLLRNTRMLYESGFAEQVDVDRVRVQHNNAKVEQENFARNLALSYTLLKFQMGMDSSAPLTLEDRIEDIRFEVLDESVENNFKYEDRIEHKLQEVNMNLLSLDIKNTQSQYLPTFHLYGDYGGNIGTTDFSALFGEWSNFGSVGLRLKVPIFDGLKKTRVIQQKKLELSQLKNSQNRLKQSIDLEIIQAKTSFQKSIERMKSQWDNMKLAENIYKVSVIKYEAGVGSNTDVVNADSSLTEAQINYHVALYDALIAKVDLEKAYGKLYRSP